MAKIKIFDLIQSLTMSEKRFFKVFSNRHVIGEENDYVKLFDLIEKMEEYNEDLVRKARFVKNSSAEKNYLYNLIMRSLTVFHNQSSSKIKVYDYLVNIEILFQKGLYDQCLELIKKTKKIAAENELFRQLLTVTEIEQEILSKGFNYEEALTSIKEDRSILDRITNIADITYLSTKGYQENLSIGVARSENQLKAFNELLKHPFLKNRDESLSQRAVLHQLSLPMTYNMVAGNTQEVIDYAEKIINHYEQNEFLIEYTPIGYVSSIFILGSANRSAKNYKTAIEISDKLAEIGEHKFVMRSQKARAYAIYYHAILKMQLLLNDNQFSQALEFYDFISPELKAYEKFIGKPQLYDLYFQFSKLFFVLENYKKTLLYTNEILNDLKFIDRDDFSITVRLFNLIVHFELNNDFTLEYLSKSTFSYLKRKDKLYEAEKAIIRFLENHYKFESRNEVYTELEVLKSKLEQLSLDKFEKGAMRLFDFSKWVESKLEKKKLALIV